jgi:hypothetical protein
VYSPVNLIAMDSPAFTGFKVKKVTREKGIAIMEMEEN